jgi:hypothetical protein
VRQVDTAIAKVALGQRLIGEASRNVNRIFGGLMWMAEKG